MLPNFKLHIYIPGDFWEKMVWSHLSSTYIQNLENGDHALRFVMLIGYVNLFLFSDVAQFTRDGVNNC